MKRTSKELIQVQVGAFLVLGTLLAMIAIFVLSTESSFFQNYYTLYCDFDDISGLRIGSPIQLAGVQIGNIEDIQFVALKKKPTLQEDKPAQESMTPAVTEEKIIKVRLKLNVDKNFQERIREDSIASVVTQGVLGDRMVYITVGTNDRILQDGDQIDEIRNPTGFTNLVQQADLLLVDVKKFLGKADTLVVNLNDVVTDIKKTQIVENFDGASGHVFSISRKIDEGQGTAGALVNDPSLYQDLKSLLGKANRNRLLKSIIRYTLRQREKEQLKSPE